MSIKNHNITESYINIYSKKEEIYDYKHDKDKLILDLNGIKTK